MINQVNRFGRLLCAAAVVIVMVGVARGAAAQVTVSSVIMTFQPGKRPVQNVMVGNSSDNPAYVLASVEKILDPEAGGNTTEPSENILISPKAFSIEPRGSRATRLLLRAPPAEKEEVYRIVFTPQDRGFGTTVKKEIGGRSASIRVLTGMGVLLFVEPVNPVGKLRWERAQDTITFSNSGNLHVELSDGKACKGDTCSPLERKRVYPAAPYTVKVDPEARVTYLVRTGSAGAFETLAIEAAAAASTTGEIAPAPGSPGKR